MKKWVIIIVVAALFSWAIYDFAVKDDTKNAEQQTESTTTEKETDKTETKEDKEPVTGLERGNIAPDFELETVDGETVKLSDYRGQKVLLNFWATWCPPCRAEMPDMQKFHEKYDDGVILAVNLTETEQSPENVDEFLEKYGITFAVLSDASTEVATLYNASALPTSYLIDTEGKVHNIAVGALNYEMMVQEFNKMK